MNLQYIYDDTTSPPTQSILQYKVDPDTVYVSTDTQTVMVNLTITVFNPTAQTVNCQNFQFGISVGTTESSQLASTDSGVQLTTDQNQWSTNTTPVKQEDLYWYTASPAEGAASEPLAASGSFVFHLENIPVSQIEGGTQFMILEITGADPNGVQGSLSLSKEQGSVLLVPGSFTVIPPEPVGQGTQVNLSWELGAAAEYWLLYNATSGQLLYDSRHDSQPQKSWQDTPEETTTYELIVYAGQMFTTASTVAMVYWVPQFTRYPVGLSPWMLAYDGTYIWVGRYNGNTITRLRAADGMPYGNYTVGNLPQTLLYDGFYIWVGNGMDGTVTRLIAADGTNQGTYGVGGAPQALAYDGTYLWVAINICTLVRILPTDGSNQGTYTVTANPITGLAYDGTYIWVANGADYTVTRLLATDGSNQGTFPTGNSPIALLYDGTYIWIANNNDDNVVRLRATDGSHQGTFPVGVNPRSLAYDGERIWVGCVNDNDNMIRVLHASDGSQFMPSISTPQTIGLLFDGKYLWGTDADENNGTLMKMTTPSTNKSQLGAALNPSIPDYWRKDRGR